MDEIIQKLTHSSSFEFYKGISALKKLSNFQGAAGAELLLTAAHTLSSESAVPKLEQAERVEAILAAINLNPDGREVLAAQAFERLPSHILNSLAKFLPPLQKRALTRAGEKPHQEDLSASSSVAIPIEIPDFSPAVKIEPVESAHVGGTAVILLSMNPQESNKQLLLKSGFSAFKYDTFEKFQDDFQSNSDVCACIVDESFLLPLDKTQQKDFLTRLSSLSTLLWIRIDERGLKLQHDEVIRIMKISHCKSSIACEDLSIQPSGVIRETELNQIRRAQEIVSIGDSVQLIPAELTKSELRLLVSAIKQHYQQYEVEDVVALKTVETRFLQGGFSSAKIILVNLSGSDNFIVAKIGDKEQIFDEMERYSHFIKKWNDSLHPVASFHSESAVILFNFVGDGADNKKPAPVLEDIIDELWNSELFSYNPEKFSQKVGNLCTGFERFARSLSTLNQKSPTRQDYKSLANPPIEFITRLEDKGITWGFTDRERSARIIAQRQYERLATSGIVHGDLHFKNILVRSELDFSLIDYAGSGPGHPAVDICRMMVALFSVTFKQQNADITYEPIVDDVFINRKSKSDVYDTYANLKTPQFNEVCISACIDSREHAIKVVEAHSGNFEDYIAAITLVAWQSLLMKGRQTSLLRILVCQLSQYILRQNQPGLPN